MPQGYALNEVDGVLEITFDSPPMIRTVMEAGRAVAAHEPPALRRLWDLRCGIRFGTDQLRHLASDAHRRNLPQGSRIALVANEDVSFGLSRMFAVYREDDRARTAVFRSREEAVAWLLDRAGARI